MKACVSALLEAMLPPPANLINAHPLPFLFAHLMSNKAGLTGTNRRTMFNVPGCIWDGYDC